MIMHIISNFMVYLVAYNTEQVVLLVKTLYLVFSLSLLLTNNNT